VFGAGRISDDINHCLSFLGGKAVKPPPQPQRKPSEPRQGFPPSAFMQTFKGSHIGHEDFVFGQNVLGLDNIDAPEITMGNGSKIFRWEGHELIYCNQTFIYDDVVMDMERYFSNDGGAERINTTWAYFIHHLPIQPREVKREDFIFGEHTLTLSELGAPPMTIENGMKTFRWQGHQLVYRDQKFIYDGVTMPMEDYFRNNGESVQVSTSWSYFINELPILPRDRPVPPQIKDELTDDPVQACVICLDNRKCTLLSPCHHLALCGACSVNAKGNPCPLCRVPVTQITHVFT
jgi:hypothetical protein